MSIDFFNILWIYFLYRKSLFGFRLDTSKLSFSIVAKFILFYKVDFWFNKEIETDYIHGRVNEVIDLIIPFVCDIQLIKEVK